MGRHSAAFEALCEAARSRITEVEPEQYLASPDAWHLVDVREDNEFASDRIVGATHIGKGVIERDIERHFAHDAPILLYCGGGYRSALAADALQKMGFTKVASLVGGIRWFRDNRPDLVE